MSENSHASHIKYCLESDFEIIEQVRGLHLIENEKVKIDLMIRPKSHLIAAGFDDCWVGVEVKFFRDPVRQIGKVARLLWQSITYRQSEYDIGGLKVRPQFVLMASNIYSDTVEEEELRKMYRPTLQVANLAMVGLLEAADKNNWNISFVSSGYMRKKHGILHRTNTSAGRGSYIGNSARKRKR